MIVTQRKEYYQEEKRGRSKTKAPKGSLYTKKKVKLGPMVSFIFLACMFLAVVLSYVAIHASMAGTAFEINQMEKQVDSLQNENERLQLQIMNLTSLDRIEQVARANLQMVRPEEVQFVALPASKMPKENTQIAQKNTGSKGNMLAMLDNLYKDVTKNVGNSVAAEAGTF